MWLPPHLFLSSWNPCSLTDPHDLTEFPQFSGNFPTVISRHFRGYLAKPHADFPQFSAIFLTIISRHFRRFLATLLRISRDTFADFSQYSRGFLAILSWISRDTLADFSRHSHKTLATLLGISCIPENKFSSSHFLLSTP